MGANLITLEEYKDFENKSSLKDDTQLNSIITSVSQLVKTYCANSFVDYVGTTEKTETFTINWPAGSVQVSESPLINVSLVEERSSYSSGYTTLSLADFEYYVDLETDSIYRTNTSGFSTWAQGPGSVRITYNAGYDTLPEDLKLAVIDLVNYYFKNEHKPSMAFGGASISNESSSTQWRNVGFPDHIKRVLDLYKNIRN